MTHNIPKILTIYGVAKNGYLSRKCHTWYAKK